MFLTMNSPVRLHLLPEDRQVVVTKYCCIQSVDAFPRVSRGMRGLAVVLDGDTGKTVGSTSHKERHGRAELRSASAAQLLVIAYGCKQRVLTNIMARKCVNNCSGSFKLTA